MTSAEESADTQRPDWVCQRAIAWVLDESPCPAELVSTLVVIARRCDEHGRGSYQSNATMAKKTGKSADQVHADVKRLLELDLIRLGDQSLPARHGVPEGRRPVVYDVNMGLRGEKPSRAGRNKTGKNKKGSEAATPGTRTRGGMDTTSGTDTPGRGGIHTTPTPGMDTTQTTPMNNPLKQPNEVKWPGSARFAPEPGDADEKPDPSQTPTAPPDTPNRTEHQPEQWRTTDKALFKAIVGEKFRSRGRKPWRPGEFPTDGLYQALMDGVAGTREPVDWPGRFLARIEERDGLDDWLLSQGFELLDHDVSAAA